MNRLMAGGGAERPPTLLNLLFAVNKPRFISMNAGHMSETKATTRVLWAGGIIALAVVIAYANSFSGAFVFDDEQSIQENPTIRHLSAISQVLNTVSINSTANGRPMLNLSLAINYAISGSSHWSYHAVNLLIHLAAALTLFGIARRTLLLKSGKAKSESAADSTWVAFIIALLWGLHPLQTESVTYMIQRAESLMGLCYLFTLYAFIRGAETKAGQIGNRKSEIGNPASESSVGTLPPSAFRFPLCFPWFALSFLACLMGMATKEDMVSAPVIIFLYDRTFVSGSFKAAWQKHRRVLLSLAGTWVLLAYLVASVGGNRGGSKGFGVGSPWLAYALTQFRAIRTYLYLTFWPHPLIFDYDSYWVRRLPEILPDAVLLAALVVLTFRGLSRRTAVGFLGAWFFSILAPTSLMPATSQMIVEHRMYLPLAAVLTVFVLAVERAIRLLPSSFQFPLSAFRFPTSVSRFPLSAVPLLLLAAVWFALTVHRNHDYRTNVALWTDELEKCPDSALAHCDLGNALLIDGRPAEALVRLEEALRLNPGYAEAYDNVGTALYRLHRPAEAIPAYEQALALQPTFYRAHTNLGIVLAEQGRVPEAIAHYEIVLKADPRNAPALFNLGNALAQAGRQQEAVASFEAALRIRGDYPEAACNLGKTFAELGRIDEAVACYREGLRLKPDYPECYYNLGNIEMQRGRLADAIGDYEKALRLRPAYAEADSNLGIALLGNGDPTGAAAHFEAALRADPHYAVAEYNLGNVYARTGRIPEAVAHYEAALRLDPGSEGAHANIGNALYQLGQISAAIAHYEAALKLSPGNVRVRYNLANAYLRTGRTAEAAEQYAEALRLKPDFAEARAMLARLRP